MFYLLNATKTAKNYGTSPNKNSLFGDDDDEFETEDSLLLPRNLEDTDAENLLNIDEALQRLGMGRFQYRIMLATGLFLAADSMEVVILSFLSHVAKSRQWQDAETLFADNSGFSEGDAYEYNTADGGDTLSTMVLPSAIIGAIVWGIFGDLVGRRVVFLLVATIVSVFGVATSFASTFQWLLLTRILVSFGIGGLTVPFNACAELLPPSARGKQLVLLQVFWTTGALAVHLALQQTEQEDIADSTTSWWRLIAGLCAIPSVIALILAWLFVPESPRWLVAQGNQDIALAILRHAAEINSKDPYETFPKGTILYSLEPEEVTCTVSQVMTLFSSAWTAVTAALAATYFGKAFMDHGTVTMAVTIFSQDTRQQDYQALFTASAEFLSLILVYHLIDRWGRTVTQCLAYALGGLVCLILSLIGDYNPAINPNTLLVMAFMAHLFINSATTATWIATTEVLSTAIRTTGHGTAHSIARVGGAFSTYVLARIYSIPTIGLILFVTSIWTASASSKLPETNVKEMGVVHYPNRQSSSAKNERGRGTMNSQQQYKGVI